MRTAGKIWLSILVGITVGMTLAVGDLLAGLWYAPLGSRAAADTVFVRATTQPAGGLTVPLSWQVAVELRSAAEAAGYPGGLLTRLPLPIRIHGSEREAAVIVADDGSYGLVPMRMQAGAARPSFDADGCTVLISSHLASWPGGHTTSLGDVIDVGGTACSVGGIVAAGGEFPESQIEVWTTLDVLRAIRPALFQTDVGAFVMAVRAPRAELPAAVLGSLRDTLRRVSADDVGLSVKSLRATLFGSELSHFVTSAHLALAIVVALSIGLAAVAFAAMVRERQPEWVIRVDLGARPKHIAKATIRILLPIVCAALAVSIGLWSLTIWALPLPLQQVTARLPWSSRQVVVAAATAVLLAHCAALGAVFLKGTSGALAMRGNSHRWRRHGRGDVWCVGLSAAVAVGLGAVALVLGARLWTIHNSDLGPDWERLVAAELPVARSASWHVSLQRLEQRLSVVPGVLAFGLLSHVPFETAPERQTIAIDGRRILNGATEGPAAPRVLRMAGRALEALGVLEPGVLDPLAQDNSSGAQTPCAISTSAVRQYFPGGIIPGSRIDFVGPMRRGQSQVLFSCNPVAVAAELPFSTFAQDPQTQLALPFGDSRVPARFAVIQVAAHGGPSGSELLQALGPLEPVRVVDGRTLFVSFTATEHAWTIAGVLLAAWGLGLGMVTAIGASADRAIARTRDAAVLYAVGATPLRAGFTQLRPLLLSGALGVLAGAALAGVSLKLVPFAAEPRFSTAACAVVGAGWILAHAMVSAITMGRFFASNRLARELQRDSR